MDDYFPSRASRLRRSSSRLEYAAARIASSDSRPLPRRAADGCRRRDEPGQHEQVAVAERHAEISTHHGGVEDEQCPRQVQDIERQCSR